MLETIRTAFRPSLLLLLVTGALLCGYVVVTVPPLVEHFKQSLDSHADTTRSLLIQSARQTLLAGDRETLARYAREVSRLPYIEGIVVSSHDNRVVAGAWLGESLSPADALGKVLHAKMLNWPLDSEGNKLGVVFVAFDKAWPARLKDEVFEVGSMIVGLVLLFALLVSVTVREHLGIRIAALRRATARLAKGDYDVRLSARGKGPITELTRNFNKMAADLGAFTNKLRVSDERFTLAVNGSNEAIWDWDLGNGRLYLSPRFSEILGYGEDELPGMFTAFQRLIHPQDKPQVLQAIDEHIADGRTFRSEFRVLTRSASWRWMLGRGTAVRDASGSVTRMAGSFADITEQKAAQMALERGSERMRVTLQSIADAVITTDTSAKVTYVNPAAVRLTGWPYREAIGRPVDKVLAFISEFGAWSIADALNAQLEGLTQSDLGQAQLLSRSGEKHIVEHSLAALRSKDEEVIGGVIVIHDISDRYKLMQQLSHQATHDPLTQLVNRLGFEMRLDRLLKPAEDQERAEHAICYMDLDQFKVVNDTCGHQAGDELLRQIAVQLKQHVRRGDTLARLGGDEFGLLLEICPLSKAKAIAEQIRRSVEAFRFSWEDKSFSIGVSIGLAPFDAGPGTSATSILASVDQACYIAKSKGRNRIHTHQPGDSESSRWHKEMQWVPYIHQAMDEGHFMLVAQPIVPVDRVDTHCRHYEVLLRMRSKNGELISPGAFLPAAERYDLMGLLDRWVVTHAIDMLGLAWRADPGLAQTTFGINISGAVLTDNSLLTNVKEALESYGLPPGVLCFEITETTAIANFSHANRFVNELKEIGCHFALDDFGSGFASFSYLKTLPVDYLKIDGSFVRHLVENEVDYTMVDIINQLGHVMGLKTIAEFVENGAILEALSELEVDYAQGYHIGRPIPLQDICYGEGTEAALRIVPS